MISQNKQNVVTTKDIIALLSAYTSHAHRHPVQNCAHLNGPCIKSLPAFITLCLLAGAKLYFLVSAHISKITWNLFLWKSLRSLCMYVHNGDLSSLKEGGRFSSLSSFHPPANEIKRQAAA
jgi:hypothetical protein